ncbi:PEP-related development arrested 1 [Scenedesmus sp. PABB004]|nr:PEP-related development arrested 1 [Scenedesmus sp. PABB004]
MLVARLGAHGVAGPGACGAGGRRAAAAAAASSRRPAPRRAAAAGAAGDAVDGPSSSGRTDDAAARQPQWGTGWARRGSGAAGSGGPPRKPSSYFARPKPPPGDGDAGGEAGGGSAGRTPPGAAAAAAAGVDADAARPPPADPALEASIRAGVDRAAATLQDIVTEVLNELLVEEASAYVMDEEGPGLALNQAARNAVVKRLEWLDSNFLAALNAYLAAPSVQRDGELVALLGAVRTEVLELVAARLPASVQVLNAALQHAGKQQREELVARALNGGGGALPGASLDELGGAAIQLVDDMEDQQVVADRALLARLVLVREELRAMVERQDAQLFTGSSAPAAGGPPSAAQLFAFHRTNLPARCAAFMKELLVVPEQGRRLGLLTKAFQEDWVGEAPAPPGGAAPAAAGAQGKPETLDIVRPGRFLSTLHAMRAELELQLTSGAVTAEQLEAGAPTLAVLRQLDAIRVEAMAALDRIQRAAPAGARPAASAGGGGGRGGAAEAPHDYELALAEHE